MNKFTEQEENPNQSIKISSKLQWADVVVAKSKEDRAPRESPLKEWWLEQQRIKEQNVK